MTPTRATPHPARSHRLVFLDVDGTLVNSERVITERTKVALARAKRAGMRLSLATGRTFESAKPYIAAIGADAPLVLFNGARVQHFETGEVLREWRLSAALASVVVETVRAYDVHLSLFHQEATYIAQWNERARASAAKDGVSFVPVGDLASVLDRDPIKLMLIGEPATLDELRMVLFGAFAMKGHMAPSLVRSEVNYLEVWHAQASKGAAAAWVADELGVPLSQTVAFGDNLNDLELLRRAGLGVAMGNAHPELKRVAQTIAASNDEDGVAQVLESLLGGA